MLDRIHYIIIIIIIIIINMKTTFLKYISILLFCIIL